MGCGRQGGRGEEGGNKDSGGKIGKAGREAMSVGDGKGGRGDRREIEKGGER